MLHVNFETSNGWKIARIAPILTIFGRNRSRRPKLKFEKIFHAVVAVVIIDGPPIPGSHNFRRSVDGFLFKGPALIEGFTVQGCGHGTNCNLFAFSTRGARNRVVEIACFLWHKLWLHFFWPTFWLHCILYRTYMGGEAPPISKIQNTMQPESWPKEMEP